MEHTSTDTAVHDVMLRCREAAEQYSEATRLVDDAALSELLSAMAFRRVEAADALEECLESARRETEQGNNEHPGSEPLIPRLKAALSERVRTVLLNECIKSEQSLSEAAAEAAADDRVSEDVTQLLNALLSDIETAVSRLKTFAV